MTKKPIMLILCVCLLFACATAAVADDNVELSVESAYFTDSALVSFLKISGEDIDIFKVSSPQYGEISLSPTKLAEDGGCINYVLLLDVTLSMEDRIDRVKTFLSTLDEAENWQSRFVIIPYNSEIFVDEIVDTINLEKDENELDLGSALDQLEFYDSDNRSATALLKAMDYIETAFPAKTGELVNLILVTDGELDVSSADAEEVANRLAKTPEFVLHTLIVGNGKAQIEAAGMNLRVNKDYPAEDAANEIIDYISSLYKLVLPWSVEQQERASFNGAMEYKNSGEEIIINTLEFSIDNVPLMQEYGNYMYLWGQKPAENLNAADEKEEVLIDIVPDNSENMEQSATGEDITESSGVLKKILFISIPIAVIIGLVILLVLASRKKGKSVSRGNFIHLHLEVTSGKLRGRNTEFELHDELLIGSDKQCQVVFDSSMVSPYNTRVYMKDGFVYICDLNSENGTEIEGMQIYSPNRLRSGNEISIGNVRFSFHF